MFRPSPSCPAAPFSLWCLVFSAVISSRAKRYLSTRTRLDKQPVQESAQGISHPDPNQLPKRAGFPPCGFYARTGEKRSAQSAGLVLFRVVRFAHLVRLISCGGAQCFHVYVHDQFQHFGTLCCFSFADEVFRFFCFYGAGHTCVCVALSLTLFPRRSILKDSNSVGCITPRLTPAASRTDHPPAASMRVLSFFRQVRVRHEVQVRPPDAPEPSSGLLHARPEPGESLVVVVDDDDDFVVLVVASRVC